MKKLLLALITIAFSFSCITGLSACTNPEEEVPVLIKLVRTGDKKQKSQAALRLARIGPPHANAATQDLIILLKNKNPGVQSAAAYALREIDTPEARAALDRAGKRRK